jgi:hypothetical protein
MASEYRLKSCDENSQISAENLGIIPYGQRNIHLRSALYTARSGLLDPALNWITGRKLKKEVIVEYKEQMLIKLDYLFLPVYSNIKNSSRIRTGISILLC